MIVVGVRIDETRREHFAACIDLARGTRLGKIADRGNPIVDDREITFEGGCPAAVDNACVFNDEIVALRCCAVCVFRHRSIRFRRRCSLDTRLIRGWVNGVGV